MVALAQPEHIKLTPKEFRSEIKPDWCPGCGDFAVLAGLQQAMAKMGERPENFAVVSGIGCSSNIPGYLSTYGFHGIHGRSVAVASGVKLGNPSLHVVAAGGDGDGYGIGVGHFIHAMRRNLDITYIVMDNQTYGLTTGQASPTSMKGHKTKSSPDGTYENPINPIALALAAGATYVSRGFSADMKGLAELIEGGIRHKGFALVDVFSPCVTFNKINTYDWFRSRVYNLQKEGHDPADIQKAFARSLEWGDRIPLGLFYQTRLPTYDELEPAYAIGPPPRHPLGLKNADKENVLAEFK